MLLINCNMLDIFFVISSPFLSILVIYFSIGTVKVMYLSVFSPKQVNCFLNFSASSYMIIIIRSIMKNYRNFFSYTIFQITCAMRIISILSCNDSDFYFCDTFHLSNIYFQIFLYRYSKFLNFHMIPAVLLLIASSLSFLKLVISLRALLRIHKTLSWNLYLCIHHAYFLCF